MTQHRLVSLRLPDNVIDALDRAARMQGRSPADVVRALLEAALSAAPLPERMRGGSLALVLAALGAARGWLDLQTRLRMAGFVLRLSEAGVLTLNSWPANRALMPIEALGTSLPALCIRFRAPFPGAVPARATSTRPTGKVA
ncbi:MAG: CopG family transcriptional regulator [Phaeovulum sp.]|uniref:ribbon-helix-helix domain-containing protein n=1 Tax=Phaeovulum sp. TaxID=2934796 RepID=UPI002731F921|nr:CopG family transcriptional regulator [Phaeovulum sp.]MDP2061498.1 CopG family transcriptional regulator [Phaeovulum sp.]